MERDRFWAAPSVAAVVLIMVGFTAWLLCAAYPARGQSIGTPPVVTGPGVSPVGPTGAVAGQPATGLPCEHPASVPYSVYGVSQLPCWLPDFIDATHGGDGWGWEYAEATTWTTSQAAMVAATLDLLHPGAPEWVRRVVREAVIDSWHRWVLWALGQVTETTPTLYRDRVTTRAIWVWWAKSPKWVVIPGVPLWAVWTGDW